MDDQGSLFDVEEPPILCMHCGQAIEWQEAEQRWMHTKTRLSRCTVPPFYLARPREDGEEVAHARRSDPITSHEAAASLESEVIRKSQGAVLTLFQKYGPMYDQQLVERYQEQASVWSLPPQSVSGIRTRRSELVAKGVLEDSGTKIIPAGSRRRAIIWRVSANGASAQG